MSGAEAMTSPAEGLVVLYLNYPLAIGARASQHYEELLREFNLMMASGTVEADSPVATVTRLVRELTDRHARNTELEAPRMEALLRGETHHDFRLPIQRDTLEPAVALDEVLDRADDISRQGHTLVLPPGEDIVAFRRWYLREMITQLEGGAARPWSDRA